MPLDGVTLRFLRSELSCAIGSRIEKIHQPERFLLSLTLRGKDFSERLLICARPDAPRLHFSSLVHENPESPPMFCMFLRKRLTGARLVRLRQEGLERILYFDFAATNELGDPSAFTLCVELIPGKSNIMLLQDNVVLDAIRRIYPEMDERGNAARAVLPGAQYVPPEKPVKLNSFTDILDDSVKKSLLNAGAEGLSPLLLREITLHQSPVKALKNLMESDGCTPTMLRAKDGSPKDFSCMTIKQYAELYSCEQYPDLSSLLEAFYSEREKKLRLSQVDGGLRQALEKLIARTRRRVESQRSDLARAENRDELRRFADLILSQQYKLHIGSAFYDVDDYENQDEMLRIKADPRLSPAANAQAYYKRYQKARNAETILRKQIERGKVDLEYLENSLDSLSRASGRSEISALREELVSEGFLSIRSQTAKAKKRISGTRNHSGYLQYFCDEFQIIIGQTATQNERVAFKESRKGDLWLHAQKVPGAHVLIRAEGREIPVRIIEKAAALAAYHSAARGSGKVTVDLVQAKKLKKPASARPGVVIYHEYESIVVKPHDV